MSLVTLRYVNHIDIPEYESAGWKVRSKLHWPHSQHAVLMIKETAGENQNDKEKVNENK